MSFRLFDILTSYADGAADCVWKNLWGWLNIAQIVLISSFLTLFLSAKEDLYRYISTGIRVAFRSLISQRQT